MMKRLMILNEIVCSCMGIYCVLKGDVATATYFMVLALVTHSYLKGS